MNADVILERRPAVTPPNCPNKCGEFTAFGCERLQVSYSDTS
jgi:hypothetical protein